MLYADNFKGVSIVAPPPVGHLYLQLAPGLTALYGKNGAGKTLTLTALKAALQELSAADFTMGRRLGSRGGWFKRSTIDVIYRESCLHFHAPVTKESWDDGDISDQLKSALVRQFGSMSEAAFNANDMADWDDIVLGVLSALPNEATIEIAENYLQEGRWLVSSKNGALYLCDRDPLQGHFASSWNQSWLEFENSLQTPDENEEHEKQWREGEYGETYSPVTPTLFKYVTDREAGADGAGGWQLKEIALTKMLPPPPWLLGLPSFPSWMSLPIAAIGTIRYGHLTVIAESDEPISNSKIAKKVASNSFDEIQSNLDRLASFVNPLLAKLFEHPPLLRATISETREIFHGIAPVTWSASTNDLGTLFPAESLGRAHRRYFNFVLERALDGFVPESALQGQELFARFKGRKALTKPLATFAIIDEPELALHAGAQRYLAESVKMLADYVITATHSGEFIDLASSTTLVSQNDGRIELNPFLIDFSPQKRISEARRLGTTPGQLALLTRAVLFVEGPHDAEIIGAFLKDEIQQNRVQVVSLMGTKDVPELVNTEFLVGATNCPIFICLDNIDLDFVLSLHSKLKKAASQKQQRFLLAEANDSVAAKRSQEVRQMIRTMSAVAASDMLQRFNPFGFAQHDIVQLLPVELIRPGATTWEQIEIEFLAEKGQKFFLPGDGAAFKSFVGPGYTVNGIREALDRLRLAYEARGGTLESNRPPELDRLASQIFRVVSNAQKQ